ncbi:MAG: hypothetical protein WAK93_09660 [Solirubrobacteraceae bacterium]
MPGDALFLGWGQVVRGREQFSLEVFQESLAYYQKLQDDGRIERYEAFLLGPHGGDLGGFIMMHGDRATIDEIRASDDFIRLAARAGMVIDNLGIVDAYTGEELGRRMGIYGEVSQQVPQAK